MLKHKERNNRSILLFLVIFLLLSVPIALFGIIRGASYFSSRINSQPSTQSLRTLWQKGDYLSVLSITDSNLDQNPMDAHSLFFRGLASYYTAISQISAEDESLYLNNAIVSLRKLLIRPDAPKREMIYYVLGKSYLMKGRYYANTALEYLQMARDAGYENTDTFEFMGEAYSILGDFQKSIEYYEKALNTNNSDRLYLKIAEDCFNFGEYNKSAVYYNELLNRTNDESLKKKGLFQLGKLYYDIGNFKMAKVTFQKLNEIDPGVAESHFMLGETYFYLNDNTEARKEWHRTLRIDPEHRNARLRLYN